MITDVSEYLFVTGENIDADHPHGDLDRIIIDGDIMPLRTGTTSNGVSRKNLLRGEDPAFLYEAACERETAADVSMVPAIFTRKVDGFNLRSALGRIKNVAPHFISSMPSSHLLGPSEQDDPFALSRRSAADISTPSDAFDNGKPLSRASVESLFNDLKSLTMTPRYQPKTFGSSNYEVLRSLVADYPMSTVPGVSGGVTWRDYGGRTIHDPDTGDEIHNAYGGNARTTSGFSASAPAFAFPVSYHWFGEFFVEQGSTREFVIIDLGLTTAEISVSGATLISLAQSAVTLAGCAWEPGSVEMTEDVNHTTNVSISRAWCVVTLGNHTKWWND